MRTRSGGHRRRPGRLSGSLVASPEPTDLIVAFGRLTGLLAAEIDAVDPRQAAQLRPVLTLLVETAVPTVRP